MVVNGGVDSNKIVYPILTDTSGRQYVLLTDGTNDLYIWGSGAVTTVNEVHWRIKESKQFFVSHRFAAVADAAEVLIHIKVDSTKSAHGSLEVESDGKCWVDFYENPTTSADGTGLTELNLNRETDASPVTAVYHTPTKSANGTLLEYGVMGAAGRFTSSGGAEIGGYWWLKPNEQYLLVVTNKSGAASDIVVKYNWHEHLAV